MKTLISRSALCATLSMLLFVLPLRAQETATETEADRTIIAVAEDAGTFSTLLAALEAADLTEALQSEGPFTVFAPTDEAFAKLPEGKLDKLLQPENKDKLAAILKYHVVDGQATASDMEESVTTLEGNDVMLMANDEGLMVNEARVVTADLEASNGVIHVIDTVLMPPKGEKEKPKEKMK
jgi:uncharacterized surface protein with fasciclin (FAS1) repeats